MLILMKCLAEMAISEMTDVVSCVTFHTYSVAVIRLLLLSNIAVV